MREQKGIDGTTPIIVEPRFLLVGPQNETMAEQLVTAIQAANVTDVNVFVDRLRVLVEPRITETTGGFADPAQAEVVSYANLADRTAPQMETRDGWTTLGTESRCVYDFGVGCTDYRGGVWSNGSGDTE